MKNRIITAAAVFVLGASLAVAAPFQGDGGEGHGRRQHAMAQKLAEKLNLSDAQQQQIRDIHKSFHAENKAFFETFRQTMKDFRDARRAGDTAKMDALKPLLQSQHDQMKQLRAGLDDRIGSVLNADQRAQWEAMKAERQARRQHREQR
jgi:Spy/CpxP family protein refolding chaperone